MKEIKNIKTIEEIIYESDDGIFKSAHRNLVDDYEKRQALIGSLDDYKIGELSNNSVENLSDSIWIYDYGNFRRSIYEVKNEEEFLSIVAALKKYYNAQCYDYYELFERYSDPTFKFTVLFRDGGDYADEIVIVPLKRALDRCRETKQEIIDTENELEKYLKGR